MNFTNIGTSIFATGLGMTILSKIGVIWNTIARYIKIGYSISANTNDNRIAYKIINDYVLSFNKNSINKRIVYNVVSCDSKQTAIADGVYTIKTGKFQFAQISSTYEKKDMSYNATYHLTITFYGLNAAKEQQILSDKINIANFANKQVVKDHRNYIYVNKRSFDTIYHHKKYDIIEYLNRFIKSKDIYVKNGLAYKTGILLYGAPGTGKTSMIKAIASYMDYNIYMADRYFDIGDIEEKTIVVFEDIDKNIDGDIISDDKKSKSNSMLYTVMQLLDGLYSLSDIIFIATTNYIEKLPPELLRKGRFDCVINLDNIPRNVAEDMCNGFNVDINDVISENQEFPINPAHLQNLILQKINPSIKI